MPVYLGSQSLVIDRRSLVLIWQASQFKANLSRTYFLKNIIIAPSGAAKDSIEIFPSGDKSILMVLKFYRLDKCISFEVFNLPLIDAVLTIMSLEKEK